MVTPRKSRLAMRASSSAWGNSPRGGVAADADAAAIAALRNVRRDVMHHLQELTRNHELGDDDERRAEERVQKLTDEHTKSIDELLKHKEAEIMEV